MIKDKKEEVTHFYGGDTKILDYHQIVKHSMQIIHVLLDAQHFDMMKV